MLTQYTRYALKALLHIAAHGSDHPLPVTEIADRAQIPRKYLEAILTEARRQSFVISTRGKKGGYRLSRPPEQISFGEVIRGFEGSLALLPCSTDEMHQRCDDCQDPAGCSLRMLMNAVRRRGDKLLDGTSLASALDKESRQAGVENLLLD